jgi:hypothetical protein
MCQKCKNKKEKKYENSSKCACKCPSKSASKCACNDCHKPKQQCVCEQYIYIPQPYTPNCCEGPTRFMGSMGNIEKGCNCVYPY